MDRYKGDRSDSDSASGTPRDDRFFTPRQSARRGGSSSVGESWATPRSTAGPGWLSDEGEYATPREFAAAYAPHDHPSYTTSQQAGYQSNQQAGYQSNQQGAYSIPEDSYSNYSNQQDGYSIPEAGYPNYHQESYGSAQHNGAYQHAQGYAPSLAAHPPAQPSYGWPAEDAGYKYETQEHWDQAKQDSEYLPDYNAHNDLHQSMPKEGENLTQAIDDIFSFARHNRVEEVERLLDRGVPVNVRDMFGNTILIISCQNGNKRVAKAALRRGGDINARNLKGNTALHFCFAYGYGDSLGQYLMNKGADPALLNNAGLSCYEGL